MKILPLSEIPVEQLRIRFRSAMKYNPRVMQLSISCRRSHSLLCVLRGEYLYSWEENGARQELRAGAGDLVYSPAGSCYEYRILTADAEVIQLEFEMELDEPIALETHPTARACSVEPVFYELLRHSASGDRWRLMSSIYLLLSRMADGDSPAISPRIQPAVDHIAANFTRPISIPELARLCYISESQLRRLFKKELGMTPVEYKNTLLVRSARELLGAGEGTVSEIAAMLGFESIYSFSHFFKRETGLSPSAAGNVRM
ncbi:MAG: helix-turn-helix transcriptional regulator [Clostridia bacterium]|nr:helix-turn-helix transcriptional regulator [Clostridia bacterium]